jgi:hypothetical protein
MSCLMSNDEDVPVCYSLARQHLVFWNLKATVCEQLWMSTSWCLVLWSAKVWSHVFTFRWSALTHSQFPEIGHEAVTSCPVACCVHQWVITLDRTWQSPDTFGNFTISPTVCTQGQSPKKRRTRCRTNKKWRFAPTVSTMTTWYC